MNPDDSGSDGASVPFIIQILDADIREICQRPGYLHIFERHDAAYTLGGLEPDRLNADIAMYQAMVTAGIEAINCLTFFDAVRQFGGSHWRYPPPEHQPGVQAP